MGTRKRNSFTRKMELKSTEELRKIVTSKDYAYGAKQAAQWELEAREEDGTLELENQQRMDSQLGETRYDDFIRSIKKKRKFGFFKDPSYTESLDSDLSMEAKQGLIIKTLEKLKWHVVLRDENQVQARRPNESDKYTEQILIGFGEKNILVKSITLSSQSMDHGANSVRVKLFFHVFNETLSELKEGELEALEQKVTRENNWDDYQIPEALPQPPNFKRENQLAYMAIITLTSIGLGVLLGLGMRSFYVVILFEVATSWLLAKSITATLPYTNFTDYRITQYMLLLATLFIILTAQITDYIYLLNQYQDQFGLDFFQYMKLKIEAGFVLDDMQLGIIGWIVVFILQGLILYFVTWSRLVTGMTNYQYNRVPEEVTEYVIYLSIKNHNESQIRKALSEKGWTDRRAQDYVFAAVGAIHAQREMVKEN